MGTAAGSHVWLSLTCLYALLTQHIGLLMYVTNVNLCSAMKQESKQWKPLMALALTFTLTFENFTSMYCMYVCGAVMFYQWNRTRWILSLSHTQSLAHISTHWSDDLSCPAQAWLLERQRLTVRDWTCWGVMDVIKGETLLKVQQLRVRTHPIAVFWDQYIADQMFCGQNAWQWRRQTVHRLVFWLYTWSYSISMCLLVVVFKTESNKGQRKRVYSLDVARKLEF